MGSIIKKEFRSYFTSPIGYVTIAVIVAISAYYFDNANLTYGVVTLKYVFSSMMVFALLAISLLTMRIFSEERKQKTDQLLFTSPVSLTSIVVGKFIAAFVVFLMAISITLVFGVVINFFAIPNWSHILGNFIGLALLGGVIISIGILISSATENQAVAAFSTFGVVVMFLFVDSFSASVTQQKWLAKALDFISIQMRYAEFTNGIIAYDNIIFFISLQALFLFLTVRLLDSKRWR